MEPLSQIFLRHRERLLGDGTALWFNPPGDLPWREFPAPHGCSWQTQDEMARVSLANTGLDIQWVPVPVSDTPRHTIVLSVPREKARLRLLAAAMASHMPPDGVMYLAGEGRAGGRSAPAQLKGHFGTVHKLDSARHCVLFAVSDPLTTGKFRLSDYLTTWALDLDDRTVLEVCSYPGVFADGGLDAGTSLLLDQLDTIISRNSGTALDLGCGAGVIGAMMLRRFPGWNVDMADSNALAVSAARATLEHNQLDARVFASDGLKAINARYDLIISNPPFHAGHRERDDLGSGVFDGVQQALKPGGRVVMVANRHLPWRRWMDATFGGHTVLAANNAYHVLTSQH